MQHVRTSGPGDQVAALDVAAVSHSYGSKRALSDVSFSIAPATFTVLLGLNGAGKTTLYSLISHLYDTRRGSIRIFGHDVSHASGEALRRVGIVFQARTLDLDLSVHQNLSYHAALHGIGGREARQRIAALLDIVDMPGRQHDKARSLSGGQMRRIEIARALLHRPSLLLLDEATVGLDIQSRAGILATIRKLVETEGIGVLWATHLIDEVDDGDHVVVLRQGELVAKGKVADVVRTSGATSIRDAFSRLSRIEAAGTAGISP
ncbi:MAG: ATP-binding cassette domain-containing protein [Mesorhizobium sp.]|nr:ATP-binding cassette domain-containing protein [Mesorhizobium sp.]RWO56696.1 MAG: ATP-binding cassette domain-containing protein [Mesorhizobium sp.]